MNNELRPKITYTQNFIRSPELIKFFVIRMNLDRDDILYEIGTGRGIITKQMAPKVKELITIEKDINLYEDSVKVLKHYENVKIQNLDFLQYRLPVEGKFKVAGNIPFNISSEIIDKLTRLKNPPTHSYLIVQKEVAERIIGAPHFKESFMSIITKTGFDAEIIFTFRKSDFVPKPRVDAVLLKIERREEPLLKYDDQKVFEDLVAYGYGQWKPNLEKAFENLFSYKQYQTLAKNLGFNTNSLPSELNVEQWLGIFEFYKSVADYKKKQLIQDASKKLKLHKKKITQRWRH